MVCRFCNIGESCNHEFELQFQSSSLLERVYLTLSRRLFSRRNRTTCCDFGGIVSISRLPGIRRPTSSEQLDDNQHRTGGAWLAWIAARARATSTIGACPASSTSRSCGRPVMRQVAFRDGATRAGCLRTAIVAGCRDSRVDRVLSTPDWVPTVVCGALCLIGAPSWARRVVATQTIVESNR